MTKVIIQVSHLRISDEITYRRGDVVDMSAKQIVRQGNSVKLLAVATSADTGVTDAIQKKDSEIKALKAAIEEMKLDVIALEDAAATPVKEETQASKTTRKPPTGAKSDKASV